MANVKFVPPRVPLVDVRTGQITREWYLLFASLFSSTDDSGGVPDPTEDTSSILFVPTDSRVDTSAQEIAALPMTPSFGAQIAALEQLAVPSPSRDIHNRLDDMELLLASLAPQQMGQLAASGRYIPTLTAGANVASLTMLGTTFRWLRIGNIVIVSGGLTVAATAAGVATNVGISLPFASVLTANYDVTGNFATPRIQQSGGIDGDVANQRAQMRFIAADLSNSTEFFNFTYEVL